MGDEEMAEHDYQHGESQNKHQMDREQEEGPDMRKELEAELRGLRYDMRKDVEFNPTLWAEDVER